MTNIGDNNNNKEKELKPTSSHNSDNSQVENQTNTAIPVDNSIHNSPPMAVLPLNSSTKLDQEPNPFEQSFSGVSTEEKTINKLKLPPVASITSPAITKNVLNSNNNVVIGGGILPKEVSNQFTWDTLRTGPLSPSMLQGPANPEEYYTSTTTAKVPPPLNSNNNSTNYSTRTTSYTSDIHYMQQQPQQHHQPMIKMEHDSYISQQQKRQRSISQITDDNQSIDSNDSFLKKTRKSTRRKSSNVANDTEDDEDDEENHKKKAKSSSKEPEDDEKRKNFLERNRIAALKCRQRKKQWLNNLQAKVEFLSSDNERLQMQSESLKEEIVNLKTLLLAHKECPVAQSNGFHASAIQKGGMPSMLSQQQQHIMSRGSSVYGVNRNQPPPNNTNNSSTSSIPRYSRSSLGQESTTANTSSGGGSSSVIRF